MPDIGLADSPGVPSSTRKRRVFDAKLFFVRWNRRRFSHRMSMCNSIKNGDCGESIENKREEDETIGACTEYVYLGTKIEIGCRTQKEIEQRIIKGKKMIGCLNSILWSTCISRKRQHLLNSIFKSIVLYECET
ncbi:hypothetical protein HUJ05_000751 [Dendroctonus ponderosae]|nr:hypothetical protein HUJ05_000751 [Dendroctonus ponderosae]